MSNDAVKTFAKYFDQPSNTVYFLGHRYGVDMLSDFYDNGKIFVGDAPDMVIVKDKTAIIIEHFEFDSSYTNKKGSFSHREDARIEREMSRKLMSENECVHIDSINASFSYQNYVSNITKNFLHHYNRIEEYKQNLKNQSIITEDYIVKIMFLIEDTSPIGSIAYDLKKSKVEEVPIVLAHCPEFLDLIADYDKVDFAMCCSCVGRNKQVWFVDRSNISSYKAYQRDYANMKFFGNTICAVNVAVAIPGDGYEKR